MKTASWIVRNRLTKEVVVETFNPKVIDALNKDKYEAVPVLEHLVGLNKSLITKE